MGNSASSVDLVILGLLKERPKSAYEIDKDVQYRHLSHWVKVSTPSVYKKVLKLCEKGCLASEAVREGNMPEKTVYSLTPSGHAYFDELMGQMAQGAVSILFEFNAMIANLNKLEPAKALALIADLKRSIAASRDFLAQMQPQRAHIPLTGRTILRQQTMVAQTLLDWIEEFEAEFAEQTRNKSTVV